MSAIAAHAAAFAALVPITELQEGRWVAHPKRRMLQRRMLYIVRYIDAKLRKIYFWHRADLISFKREGDNEYEGDQELLVCCHPGLTARSVITLPVLITPSAAQGPSVPSYYRPAPGPLVGAGIPVLVVAGGAYWVVRRLRRKRS